MAGESIMTDKPIEAPAPGTVRVSPEDLRVAYAGPAVLSNKIFATNTLAGMRLAFAELLGDQPPVFRMAVLISYPDAVNLRDLLTRQLALVEFGVVEEEPKSGGSNDNGS
jgi:hypothetical protein